MTYCWRRKLFCILSKLYTKYNKYIHLQSICLFIILYYYDETDGFWRLFYSHCLCLSRGCCFPGFCFQDKCFVKVSFHAFIITIHLLQMSLNGKCCGNCFRSAYRHRLLLTRCLNRNIIQRHVAGICIAVLHIDRFAAIALILYYFMLLLQEGYYHGNKVWYSFQFTVFFLIAS
jgi:hypothetical protein